MCVPRCSEHEGDDNRDGREARSRRRWCPPARSSESTPGTSRSAVPPLDHGIVHAGMDRVFNCRLKGRERRERGYGACARSSRHSFRPAPGPWCRGDPSRSTRLLGTSGLGRLKSLLGEAATGRQMAGEASEAMARTPPDSLGGHVNLGGPYAPPGGRERGVTSASHCTPGAGEKSPPLRGAFVPPASERRLSG